MTNVKKFLTVLVALLVPFAVAANAKADGETVSAKTTLSAKGGKFFKQVNVASNVAIEAVVTPNPSSAVVNPTKNIKFTFPAGMTFRPNQNVCPDNKIGPSTNLSLGPRYMVNQCPKAVIGTGTAVIYLGKFKAAPLNDPVLIGFNAGRTSNGQPKLKIYGYSKQTTVGILMNATLRGRVLDLAIPVLSSDSAVGEFKLEIPGPALNRPDLDINVRGLNQTYVQARCASSPLVSNAVFQMGQRDVSTGQPTSPTVTVNAPQTTQACNGLAGRARLAQATVRGPKRMVRGRPGLFRIRVKNAGTATAKNVRVRVQGRGRGTARTANIGPQKWRTFRVRARAIGRKGSVARMVFRVTANGTAIQRALMVRIVR